MKTFSSKLFHLSDIHYFTRILPTIFVYYTFFSLINPLLYRLFRASSHFFRDGYELFDIHVFDKNQAVCRSD